MPKLRPAKSADVAATQALDWVHMRHLATTRVVTARVLRALAPLRRSGVVLAAYFQRKEPGLRWRVACGQLALMRQVLAPLFNRLCAPG